MRKALFKIGGVLYHIWFYILVAVPILIALPFLILTTLSERTYKQFFWLARNIWAPVILYGMGCPPRIRYKEKLVKGESYMLVANHTSMLDIMLMLRVSKSPFVFVGKKELVNIPLFGFFYKRVCIMVDREDSRSRMGVYRRAQKRLNQGLSICIFPEGGVPEESVLLDSFKEGAFRMSIAHQIRLVPITFLDNKRRLPFTLTKGRPGPLRVNVHPFIDTGKLQEEDKRQLSLQVRQIFLNDLQPETRQPIPEAVRT
ncbi:MAG: 1-acyl-sn-glycerol-3-phosphate acyltransferase [Flavobacteriaceae bacterium]|nr:1-acyl-sn-glycerol-3-phosphate acyltransferase [Flavobacteriaceae bacterium]